MKTAGAKSESEARQWRTVVVATGIVVVSVAAGCVAAGAMVATDAWAGWFSHPGVDADLTRKGAGTWRIMLVALGAFMALGWVVMTRLASSPCAPSALERQARESDGGDAKVAATARGIVTRTQWWALAGLMVLALVLRMMRINESLWYDEIASWMVYNGGVRAWGAVMGSFLDPINHVLHTLLNRWATSEAGGLVGLLGMEAAFRLPALVTSVMTVPVMFGLGRSAMGDQAGMLAAGAAALAPVCVLEGVEARGYAQMIFFSALASWLLIEAWRRPGATWLWMLYVVVGALGVWSHFVTAWLAIGHGAWLVCRLALRRDDWRRCVAGLIALGLAGVMSVTLYSPMLPGMLAWKANFFAQRGDEPRIFGPEGWHGLLQLGGAWYWWSAAPGLVAGCCGVVAALRPKRLGASGEINTCDVFLLSAFGLPLMVLTVALSSSWLYARFMLFAMPGGLLAMAGGVDALWRWRRGAGIAAVAIVVCGWMVDAAIRPPKQPLREAMAFVNDRAQVGDGVLEVGVAHQVAALYADADKRLTLQPSYFHGADLDARLGASPPRFVLVEYPMKVSADRITILRKRGYLETARFTGWADWKHGDVVVYERRGETR